MMVVWTGRPGASKSYNMGQTLVFNLARNEKIHQKTGFFRPSCLNLPVHKDLEKEYGLCTLEKHTDTVRWTECTGAIHYWLDPMDIMRFRNCDIYWDEIGSHLDSARWADTPAEMKRWLQQHRKFGIEIYATSQDFAQIDIAAKRVVSDLIYLIKIAGSRDISATRPDPKVIWGIVLGWYLDPSTYDEKISKMEAMTKSFPKFYFIIGIGTKVFDTTYEIKGNQYPALRHITRHCELDNCPFVKISHI